MRSMRFCGTIELSIRRTLVSTLMTEPASGTNTQPEQREDTRQCRICLGGVEEEPELGRLIRPCRCKGSIRVSRHRANIHDMLMII